MVPTRSNPTPTRPVARAATAAQEVLGEDHYAELRAIGRSFTSSDLEEIQPRLASELS